LPSITPPIKATKRRVKKQNMDEEEFRTAVTRLVSEGGWSSLRSLVDSIDIDELRSMYSHIDDEDE